MPRRLSIFWSCAWCFALALAACTSDATETAARGETAPSRPGEVAAPADRSTVPEATATDAPRAVFLGTSLTAGLGLRRTEDRWPERLGEMADSAGLPVTVVNAGRSGDTSAGGLARLDWILREPVDLLVVELGANDGLRGHPPSALADNLRAVIDRTRDAWPEARILLVGMEAPTNLGAEYTGEFRRVFSRVADESDVALVPFLLEGVAGVPELNQADRIHPTSAGHARMARTVWPHFERLLRVVAEVPS